MGAALDRRAHLRDAQLGDGAQKVAARLQSSRLLRLHEGETAQKVDRGFNLFLVNQEVEFMNFFQGGMDERKLVPRLHHFVQARYSRSLEF